MDKVEWFLKWEAASRDTIDVKRTYIDVAGDLVAGVLLSQIIYWFLPAKDGTKKTQVIREGRDWLVRRREDWWKECRIRVKQFDRALSTLEEKVLVDVKQWRYKGSPTLHISLNLERLMDEIEKVWAEGKMELPQTGISNFPKQEEHEVPQTTSYKNKEGTSGIQNPMPDTPPSLNLPDEEPQEPNNGTLTDRSAFSRQGTPAAPPVPPPPDTPLNWDDPALPEKTRQDVQAIRQLAPKSRLPRSLPQIALTSGFLPATVNLVRGFLEQRLRRFPKWKPPNDLTDSFVAMEQALRLDGNRPSEVGEVIRVLFEPNTQNKVSQFWAPNIQSIPNLREHLERIEEQLEGNGGNRNGPRAEPICPVCGKKGEWVKAMIKGSDDLKEVPRFECHPLKKGKKDDD